MEICLLYKTAVYGYIEREREGFIRKEHIYAYIRHRNKQILTETYLLLSFALDVLLSGRE
jgi:hypothetical protein